MAGTKSLKRPTTRAAAPGSTDSFDLDQYVDKYIWLVIPVLVALYYWFGSGSTGFYQDDEIGHYRNIRQFWGDPFSIMGNQPKPGWKILLVVPGLFGFPGVMLAHALIAALTVVFTYKLARAMGFRNASIAALLLGVQPLWLQLSFRAYSEITASLFVILMLWSWARDRHILAAIFASYVFTIRQEFALVAIGIGVIYLARRQWLPFLALAWTPIVLTLIGWMATGNIMWLIDDMTRVGTGFDVPHKPFWHYFGVAIHIFGPVSLALFMVGYWTTFFPFERIRETLKKEGLLLFTFTVMWAWSVFSAWDYTSLLGMENRSPNPGHWRYVLSIAPLVAVYAAKALTVVTEGKRRAAVAGVLGAFVLVTLLFLSRASDGLLLTAEASYTNLLIVLLVAVLFSVVMWTRAIGIGATGVLLLIAGLAHTFATEKPRTLDVEAETVKRAAEWYLAQSADLQARPLFGNHVLFRYFADIDINDKNRDRSMQLETLAAAPKGSIVVWDSHYGNSQFGGNVPVDSLLNNTAFTPLEQIVAPDQRFGILVFEKTR